MAKSLRSKVKRAYRANKREDSVYAATAAARLDRLHAKLNAVVNADVQRNGETEDDMQQDGEAISATDADGQTGADDSMHVEATDGSKKISTHGHRGSRREEWRLSKGMPARPSSKGMNRQGGIAARRKAGRSQRRR
ncbi:hypothetical protein C8F01DRAFT_1116828 [Mycena amicta]|nr:hypothetical protein C8F01DRAFT_1116828 [Mycena amicta]